MNFNFSKRNIAIIIIILVLGTYYFNKGNSQNDSQENTQAKKEVQVVSVRELAGQEQPLPLIGEVSSKKEVSIKTESQGVITGVYKSQGEYISQGGVIAEIENSAQKAAVSQAQALVDSQKAIFNKVKEGARQEELDIAKLKRDSSLSALETEKSSVVNNLKSIYASSDSDIHGNIDGFFINPKSASPTVNFIVSDAQLKIDIESKRAKIEYILNDWKSKTSNITEEGDLFSALDEAEKNLLEIRSFLDLGLLVKDVSTNNEGSSTGVIASFKTAVTTARADINTSLTSVTNLKSALNAKTSAYNIDEKSYEQALTGSRNEDVESAEASLRQALASLDSAQANLDKTIIKSPISGTINRLDISVGDSVSLFEDVAFVSNNNLLEILSFVTPEERENLKVGSNVKIAGKWKGVVYEIAPAQDPKIKKIEIKIAITDSNTILSNGQSVDLEIQREFNIGNDQKIIIPISAIKITPENDVVFSVNEDNTLTSHPVILGSIVGNGVVIIDGLSYDMEIVKDARGLQEGQEVEVKR